MMRGPIYDDSYVSRKLTSIPTGPSYMPPHASYGRGPVGGYMQGYPPPPPPPRPAPPAYYDYDYGYGGGYGMGYPPYGGYGGYGGGYGPPVPAPRLSRYDHYLDEDLEVPSYTPRYRPRITADLGLDDADYREKPSEDDDLGSYRPRTRRAKGLDAPPSMTSVAEGETNRRLERLAKKYPSFSDSQTLQDHVDKMRVRLKSLAFSLDPSGPVPDIIIPERRSKTSEEFKQKYSSALDMTELPRLSTRRHHYYPEDEHMKDNLRIKCLSHYKTTRTAAGYCKPRLYQPSEALPSTYTSKYSSKTPAKWEEPDTVYGETTDKKPYSKPSEGDDDEAKKERRKKKKSRERDEVPAIESASAGESAEAATAESASGEAPSEASAGGTVDDEDKPLDEMDEKEKKRLEKKKRKAEREAAAKAAMEAELAALAEAEAELARLEAESAALSIPDDVAVPAETTAPASESAADKSE